MQNKWSQFFKEHGKFYLLPHENFDDVVQYFKKNDVYRVLDIGCGSGRHLVQMAENELDVVGIDYSPAAGQIAEHWLLEKGLEGKVYVADFRTELANFHSEEFDAVIAINSLQYDQNDERLSSILSEIRRVTKPGGSIFIVLPSEHSLIIQPDVEQHFFDKETLEGIISSHFEVVDIYKDKEKCWAIMARNTKETANTSLEENLIPEEN